MAWWGEILAATGCKPVDPSSAFRLKKKADFPMLSSDLHTHIKGHVSPTTHTIIINQNYFLKESLTL